MRVRLDAPQRRSDPSSLTLISPGHAQERAGWVNGIDFPIPLMAEIRRLSPCALDLPLPENPGLTQLCERILADPSTRRLCGFDAGGMKTSTRTLYRRFLRETGITFARWKQQARLLESIRRLAEGTPVTTVAIDLGYEIPSAFSTMFRRSHGIAPRAFIQRQ